MERSPRPILALFAVMGLYLATNAALQCHAQESTWIGSVSSANWFDTVRWDNGVPNAADATAIFPAGSSLILQVNQQVKLSELRINGSRALNLSGNGPFF